MLRAPSRDVAALLRSGTTPLFLAPQAGVSESPFRRLCRDFGADVVVTEFVSAVRQLGMYWLMLNEPPPSSSSE